MDSLSLRDSKEVAMRLFSIFLIPVILFPLIFVRSLSAKDCDIYVLDAKSRNPNGYIKDRFVREAYKELIQQNLEDNILMVNDLTEMQQGINNYLTANPTCCIRRLVIVGHGTSGFIAVGNGKFGNLKADDNKHMSPINKAKWEPIFKALATGNKFCKKVEGERRGVFLYSCRVGCCNRGGELIHSLGLALDLEADVFAYSVKILTKEGKNGAPGSMLKTLDTIPDGYIKHFDSSAQVIPAPSCKPCSRQWYKPPKKLPQKANLYNCPCDDLNWDGLQDCVDNCQTTLACNIGICNQILADNRMVSHTGNPILTGASYSSTALISSSSSTLWKAGGVSGPSVLVDGSTYYMYYNGWDTTADEVTAIGLATSFDGVNWTDDPTNPVLTRNDTGNWANWHVFGASVLKESGKYRMWFTGQDTGWVKQIGYAEGTQPNNFSADPDPVLSNTDGFAYDAYGLWNPAVIKDGNHYKMYYVCNDGYWWHICMATSTDGRSWARHPNNPVFKTSSDSDAWDGWYIYSPSVVKYGGIYYLYYTGRDSYGVENIGYATSSDGINWTRHPDNPIKYAASEEPWGNYGIAHQDVLVREDEGLFLVYYRGADANDAFNIGMAAISAPGGIPAFETLYPGPAIYLLLE
jgi:predicted GH43/DUF377 family glycosyl hydrolase